MEKRFEVGPQGQLRLDSVTITIGLLAALAGWLGHFFVYVYESEFDSQPRKIFKRKRYHSFSQK